ncbi:DUF354 domain-containing protein [Halorubrum ezzemoulense]|uniref:DUF354 domain-containing protein n=1 Tax=Halorubrum ezzemoulense TaxID=337243 RepID=A0ABT4Z520_HALEZ|nr:DUF354 domain-containing protein [Halorubrum ezzemoulense]MDB2293252.1 DUF354 domain-containing protein [Halorubrum ezzemoulense]
MDILIGIGHPAHVHFYRNTIEELRSRGYEVGVVTKKRDLAVELLDAYDIEYTVAGNSNIQKDSLLRMALPFLHLEIDVLREVRKNQPAVVTGIGNIPLSHASTIFDCQSKIFVDTEHAHLANNLTFPFADQIFTPECYQDDLGPKQIRYPGYHELAYLHPNQFDPDPTILNEAGLDEDERFVILRLVDWNAAHDIGDGGFDNVVDVVESLEQTGVRVFITAEGDVPEAVEHCQLAIEPHRIHHLMYYADLFIGESATMATESAVLGTPGVFVSSSRRGYTDELEERYDMVFNFSGKERQSKGIQKAISILNDYDQKLWDQKREELLEDKIDTTQFIIKQITTSRIPK